MDNRYLAAQLSNVRYAVTKSAGPRDSSGMSPGLQSVGLAMLGSQILSIGICAMLDGTAGGASFPVGVAISVLGIASTFASFRRALQSNAPVIIAFNIAGFASATLSLIHLMRDCYLFDSAVVLVSLVANLVIFAGSGIVGIPFGMLWQQYAKRRGAIRRLGCGEVHETQTAIISSIESIGELPNESQHF